MDIAVWTASLFVSSTIPKAKRELGLWRKRALCISCPKLRKQALASIDKKEFHVLGGSVYALYPRGPARQYRADILRAITAIQTISDYLDNLCDRAGESDEHAFRQLHKSMLDALDPDQSSRSSRGHRPSSSTAPSETLTSARPNGDKRMRSKETDSYYFGYPYCEDSGYLSALVNACRASLASLPGYESVKAHALHLAKLYCDLQSLKHLDQSVRLRRLKDWASTNLEQAQSMRQFSSLEPIEWWEFAAATGSTLGLFALFAIAAEGHAKVNTIKNVLSAYFPSICGLHILLDYLIDLEEDRTHNDLNFVSFYSNDQHRYDRLTAFVKEATARARSLPRPGFHLMVVRGLLALYLSDPKVRACGLSDEAVRLCKAAGGPTLLMRQSCLGLRRIGVF